MPTMSRWTIWNVNMIPVLTAIRLRLGPRSLAWTPLPIHPTALLLLVLALASFPNLNSMSSTKTYLRNP